MNITVNIQAPELANAILALASALSGNQLQAGLTKGGPSLAEQFNQAQPTQQQAPAAPPVQQPMNQQTNVVPFQQQAPTSVPTTPMQPTVQQAPAEQPQQSVPTSAPTYSMDQLAVAATQLMDAGRQAELINLLQSFNAQSLMALPKEQYGNFATKLREMGARI
jgi:hypothetical protein